MSNTSWAHSAEEERALRAAAITELQAILVDSMAVEEFVAGVAERAAQRVAPHTHVSVTLVRQGHPTTVASSDARAAACDEVEYAAGSGPCLTAIEERRTIAVAEISEETRWRAWRNAALGEGFRSSAALPASVYEGVDMALNLYSEDRDAWDGPAMARAELYAEEVGRALMLCLRATEQARVNTELRAALASRATIDQAMGVIMAQNRCSADEAFAVLRRASQHRNVKLRDVAAAVIQGITGVAPAPPRQFSDGPGRSVEQSR